MFPARHAPLCARRALLLERTALAVRAPVAVIRHAFLDAGEAPNQSFACRAAVLVPCGIVDEVGLVEPAVGLGIGGFRRRHQSVDPCFMTGQDFFTFEVAAISNCRQRCRTDCGAGLLGHAG